MPRPTKIQHPLDFSSSRKNAKRHGTRTGYVAGCRCEPCVVANREWKRTWAGYEKSWEEYVAEREATRQRHGYNAYQRGCRCAVCRTANAQVHRRTMAQMGRTAAELDTACDGCNQLFAGPNGLARHIGHGCPGPVLERVG